MSTTTFSLAGQIAAQIENFLSESPSSVVVEDGEVIFDFSNAHYSVSPERDKCVLQIWSDERNVVRRVVGSEIKGGSLRLSVLRLGQSKPTKLEICPENDRETASVKKAARAQFQRVMRRVLEAQFPGWTVDRLTAASNLENSFGPAYVRGVMKRGQSYFATIAVSAVETQPTVDAVVSTAILWLEYLRERLAARGHVEGIAVFAPEKRAQSVRLRVVHLNREIAKWRLLELDERSEAAHELPVDDYGNLDTRLVHCPDARQTLERLSSAVIKIRGMMPQAEVAVASSSQISFRLHGMEFARAHLRAGSGTFKLEEQIVFGAGPAEVRLTTETEAMFREFTSRLVATRYRRNLLHPLYRACSERWLESIVQRNITVLDSSLEPSPVYAQVPAFAATDRAMVDLLGVTREGQLAVIELKADEDRHLPMQGLDYWARVRWHHSRGEFQPMGYFADKALSTKTPLLIMAAPALHVHPATDTLLRYLSPQIEWVLLGLDEHWRDGVRVVFRKRSKTDIR